MAAPAQTAKGALRRLAQAQLEPTPQNFLSGSRFKCTEYINRGASSFVVLAKDSTNGKQHALKFIPLEQTKSKYVEREILNQFKLKHPHVIKLEEKRKASPPEFAAEEKRIRGEMIREFVTSKVDSLRAAAKIEIIPPPEAPAAEAPAADGAGAAAQ